MKVGRRLLAVLMAMVLLLSCAPLAFAEDATIYGTDGDLTWTLDSEGTLTVSGTGSMSIYAYLGDGYSTAPWGQYYSRIKTVVIGDSVTSIGDYAFYGCRNLTSVTIPDSVTSIGNFAFENCSSLTSVTIPDSVTSIGDHAFYDCSNLTSVTIPDSVTSIGNHAFHGCSSLTSVTIPDSVTSIGNHAFYNCSSLTSVTIPDSVTSIGNHAFAYCSSLTSVRIGNNLTDVKWATFQCCSNLTNVTVGNSVTLIDAYAFQSCSSLRKISFPDSLKGFGEDAFYGCFVLESVIIPSSISYISNYAFCSCGLKDVFFTGTEVQWNSISIGIYNESLTNATIHFNSSGSSGGTTAETDVLINIGDKQHYGQSVGHVVLQLDETDYFSDSASYNHEIGRFASKLCMLGYEHTVNKEDVDEYGAPESAKGHKVNFEAAMSALGFVLLDHNYNAGRDEVNYFIAKKDITSNGTTYPLIVCACIGSYGLQWNSNFDPYGTKREKNYAGNSEKGTTHLGFADARSYVWTKLKPVLEQYDSSKVKLLLTGHSRGAATANLLGAQLLKGANGWSGYQKYVAKENLFTYTFATPNNTKASEKGNEIFKRIFNLVNPTDFVVKVLPSDNSKKSKWGFGKYGTTLTFPVSSNYDSKAFKPIKTKMEQTFKQYTGDRYYAAYNTGEIPVYNVVDRFTSYVHGLDEFYEKKIFLNPEISALSLLVEKTTSFSYFQSVLCPFVNNVSDKAVAAAQATTILSLDPLQILLFSRMTGFFIANGGITQMFADAHCAESYSAYMEATTTQILKDKKEKHYYTINCPVDVEVYDKETDELVGRIINNQIDEVIASQDNAVPMDVDGDEKVLMLPANGDYEVKLTGNDVGVMDYSIRHIDEDDNEIERVNFFDVFLEDGLTYTGDTNTDSTALSDYTLTCEDGEVITPDETFNEDDALEYTVTVDIEGNGTVEGAGTYTSGDYMTLTAIPDEYHVFAGWFVNGELTDEEAQLHGRLPAGTNINATARFAPHPHTYTSAVTTAPGCETPGVRTYTCECGDSYTETVPAAGHTAPDEHGDCARCGTHLKDVCPWCGGQHEGFFQGIVAFFHRIFAGIFGARY